MKIPIECYLKFNKCIETFSNHNGAIKRKIYIRIRINLNFVSKGNDEKNEPKAKQKKERKQSKHSYS